MALRVKVGLIAGALLLAPALFATTVTIGSIDGANCYPFECNDSGMDIGVAIDYQQVYAASAFPGPMNIGLLTFYDTGAGIPAVLNGNYNIYFSYSANPVGALDSVLANNVSGPQSLFFSGPLGGPISGSFSIAGGPFAYNPASGDLLMEIVVSNQENVPNGSGNGFNQSDLTGAVTARAWCVTNFGCTGNDTGALVTTFSDAVPEPGTVALLGGGLLALVAAHRRRSKK